MTQPGRVSLRIWLVGVGQEEVEGRVPSQCLKEHWAGKLVLFLVLKNSLFFCRRCFYQDSCSYDKKEG